MWDVEWGHIDGQDKGARGGCAHWRGKRKSIGFAKPQNSDFVSMPSSAASSGDWRAVLARVGAPPASSASPLRGGSAPPLPPSDAVAAAWRVAAFIKTGQAGAAADELARLGDLDRVPGECGKEEEGKGGSQVEVTVSPRPFPTPRLPLCPALGGCRPAGPQRRPRGRCERYSVPAGSVRTTPRGRTVPHSRDSVVFPRPSVRVGAGPVGSQAGRPHRRPGVGEGGGGEEEWRSVVW